MIRSTHFLAIVVLCCLSAGLLVADVEIGSPGFPPSQVASDGSVIEAWGTVCLKIVQPTGCEITEHRAEPLPMPTAVTSSSAGTVTLTQSVYRAPVWPSGIDVLEAVVTNHGEAEAKTELELVVPEGMQMGESTGTIGRNAAILLPRNLHAIRETREWGYVDGATALPGWAKPNVDCDPAFKNIVAGMGGMPIRYRFQVEPGAKRTIVLGFCESYHLSAGVRPLLVQVEGTEDRYVDPIALWGRRVPGVLSFHALDADANGHLEITIAPHAQARDSNPILNALWVFKTATPFDRAKVLAGEVNDQAEHYVDVGGDNDQSLYKPGNLRFSLEMAPNEQREFLLLLRSPNCRVLPDRSTGLWTRESLRKAAADVWRDRWEETTSEEALE